MYFAFLYVYSVFFLFLTVSNRLTYPRQIPKPLQASRRPQLLSPTRSRSGSRPSPYWVSVLVFIIVLLGLGFMIVLLGLGFIIVLVGLCFSIIIIVFFLCVLFVLVVVINSAVHLL